MQAVHFAVSDTLCKRKALLPSTYSVNKQ